VGSGHPLSPCLAKGRKVLAMRDVAQTTEEKCDISRAFFCTLTAMGTHWVRRGQHNAARLTVLVLHRGRWEHDRLVGVAWRHGKHGEVVVVQRGGNAGEDVRRGVANVCLLGIIILRRDNFFFLVLCVEWNESQLLDDPNDVALGVAHLDHIVNHAHDAPG
jgi:hypothetical protein